MYEELSTEKRQYNQKELALFIVRALKTDERFKPGLEYILVTLQAYQRDSRNNPNATFPYDLEIDEIGVTIDDRCTSYTVGDSTISHPYADQGIIRAFKGRQQNKRDNRPTTTQLQGAKSNVICKSCFGIGHCISEQDTICYNLAKTHLCSLFMANEKNAKIVKDNTYRFKKDRKEKAYKSKVNKKMDTFIRKLEETGQDNSTLTPIINLAQQIMTSSTSSQSGASDDDTYDSE